MSNVHIIYALSTKVVRRIIVTDDPIPLSVVIGEAVLDTPFETYSDLNNQEVMEYVAAAIGSPTNSGRCVEITPDGEVVRIYSADPVIDKPIDTNNSIELNEYAQLGDKKVDGTFPLPITGIPPSNFEAS